MRETLRDRHIAVLYGGLSAEREISLRTGAAIIKALQDAGYRVTPVDVDRTVTERLRAVRPDVAFLALHGRMGEDGAIQGVLEYLAIPYTGSGVLASALALDKLRSKQVFVATGVATPPWQVADRAGALPVPAAYPVVVKPLLEGSSIGMSLVKTAAELPAALAGAFAHDRTALLEEYQAGREITVSVIGNEQARALPAVEIVPDNAFFDFAAKYTKGKTQYMTPARLTADEAAAAAALAVAAYRALGCRGLGRVDIIVRPGNRPTVLEVNTLPGMTETSLLPKAAAAAGLTFTQLLEEVLELARNDNDNGNGA